MEAKVILEAITERTKGRPLICNFCGGTRWGIDGAINMPVQDTLTTGMVIGGKSLPLISLTCEVCGYTFFLNLVRLLGRERFEQAVREGSIDEILKEIQQSMESNKEQP